jgi:hypothetical protein
VEALGDVGDECDEEEEEGAAADALHVALQQALEESGYISSFRSTETP